MNGDVGNTETAGSVLASNVKLDGYPTLDVVLSHYDAICFLIEEVSKKGGDFYPWDNARKTKDRVIKFSISNRDNN